MCQYFEGLTAKQESADSAPPMGGHKNQIAIVSIGGFDDRLIRHIAGQRQFVALNTGFLRQLFGRTKNFLRLTFDHFLKHFG